MKILFFCVYTLTTFYFVSTSLPCDKVLFYTYLPLEYGYRSSLYQNPKFISCFPPRHGTFSNRIIKSAAITCSEVSPQVYLNYTYKTEFYDQDLVIRNSTIPKFPSNSSLSTFTTIKKLILKSLGIEDVEPRAFDSLEILESLDLSSNRLVKIPEGVFDSLSTLKVLDLSDNLIRDIDKSAISGLVRLKELYLNGNILTRLFQNIFEDLKVLEVLNVSDNPLEDFEDVGFYNLKKLIVKNTYLKKFDLDMSKFFLSYFDLSLNYLEDINFDKLKSVYVVLSHNNITELRSLPLSIENLDVRHNKIEILKNDHNNYQNSSLKVLNLDFNEVSEIASGLFWNLYNLEIVYLSHNNLSIIKERTFVNCSSLKYIHLSHNQIETMEPNAFEGLPKLNQLKLSHNNLKILNGAIFSIGNNLKILYVDNNGIEEFDPRNFLYKFGELKVITVNNNSWTCDKLEDIIHVLNVRDVKIADKGNLKVSSVDGIACRTDKES